MSMFKQLDSKIFIDGTPIRISTSVINDRSILYKTILGVSFYITTATNRTSGQLSLDEQELKSKIFSSIFSYFKTSSNIEVLNVVDDFDIVSIDDLKNVLETNIDTATLSASSDALFSSNSRLVDFNHQINKIVLLDNNKAKLNITFADPASVLTISFIQVPPSEDPASYGDSSGFIAMVRNTITDLRSSMFNCQVVRNIATAQEFEIDFIEQNNAPILIALSNNADYSIQSTIVVENDEILFPFEDLKSESGKKTKLVKPSPLKNIQGETSYNAGHNHKYVLDTNGNGYAILAVNPQNSKVNHMHRVINFVVQPAQSDCYPKCVDLYDVSGVPPHVHNIDVDSSVINAANSNMRRANTNENIELQQSLY